MQRDEDKERPRAHMHIVETCKARGLGRAVIRRSKPLTHDQTTRSVRRRINKRAFALAAKLYERYRSELEVAVIEGGWSIDNLDSWLPADQRG